MRLFFSIDPPVSLQHKIAALCPVFKGIKPSPPDQLHLTLVFLGEQPDSILADIAQMLKTLRVTPLTLEFDTVGHFNSGVIWLGIKPNPALSLLQRQLCALLKRQGIDFSQRKFKPHITLARSKIRLTPQLMRSFTQAFEGKLEGFDGNSVRLKSSQLNEKGATHRIEAEILPD